MKKIAIKISVIVFVVVAIITLLRADTTNKYFEISKNLEIFNSLYKELQMYYVDDIEPGKIIKTGIDGMLSSLDPYTNYIPESDMEEYNMASKREYGGIGCLIQKLGKFVVISFPYKGLPADKAGLLAGDTIMGIDGKNLKDKGREDIRNLLLGLPGTSLDIIIHRYGHPTPIRVSLKREKIKIENVPYFGIIKENIGYIKLTGFTKGASDEVETVLDSLKKQGIKSLIIDLKNNGGGLLNEAVKIVNLFVDKGSLIVSTKGKRKDWSTEHFAEKYPVDKDIPLVVLVNKNSASASEIVSGSLQDLDRAVIIGRNSFGKGLVQQVRPISYNSKIKVTVAKYYTPSGRCIQKIDYSNHKDSSFAILDDFETLVNKRAVRDNNGIEPDVKVDVTHLPDIAISLVRRNHIFNFVTEFIDTFSKPKTVTQFEFTEADYGKFLKYIKGKEYHYVTKTEKEFEKFHKIAKKDKTYEKLESDIEVLEKKIKNRKAEDFEFFKNEIKEQIALELIGRWFYQEGQIEYAIKFFDRDIDKSIEVFKNPKEIRNLLGYKE